MPKITSEERQRSQALAHALSLNQHNNANCGAAEIVNAARILYDFLNGDTEEVQGDSAE